MQQVSSKLKWGGLLAVVAAMFVMAFALFTATPAQAAENNLAAGGASMSAQESKPGDADYVEVEGVSYATATADTDVVLSVYAQAAGSEDKTLVKQFTKKEIDELAAKSATDPVAVVYKGKSWSVGVATSYVTLDDVLNGAGVAGLWRAGSAVDVENTKYGTYAYEDYADAKFFPKTTSGETDTEGAVSVPSMVFALTETTSAIGADQTAGDMIEELSAEDKQSNSAALRVYVGATEENYAAGEKVAGNRLWSNIVNLTVIYDSAATDTMHRLYNPNSGEHFYTASDDESKDLVAAGWTDEGEGWTAPIFSGAPVYRLYNPNAGDHHYTTDAKEKEDLVAAGWNDEGIGWYSDDAKSVVLFRAYNPNAKAGSHHYTTSVSEITSLVKAGWNFEGIGWYGVEPAEEAADQPAENAADQSTEEATA